MSIVTPSGSPERLRQDFTTLSNKIDKANAESNNEYIAMKDRLITDLALDKLLADKAKIHAFYDLFAEFTESSNSFKMLYQVLLEEYVAVGVFSAADAAEIRSRAVAEIRQRLMDGRWHGTPNLSERASFRSTMMEVIRERVHLRSEEREAKGRPFAALCLSGGGIRSATFGLGVLQGLSKHKLLHKFDYLSTVSGGGYIGSWLSAWIHRKLEENRGEDEISDGSVTSEFSAAGVEAVEADLNSRSAARPEPEAVTHLRSYSNYMSPRTGLFSTDTWALIAVYLRNLLLNWTVFVPLLAAFLLTPKIFETVVSLHHSAVVDRLLLICATIAGLVATVNINAMRPSLAKFSWVDQRYRESDIGILKSVESKVLWFVLLWIVIFAVCLVAFWTVTGGNYHLSLSQSLAGEMTGRKVILFDVVIYSVFLFIGGYVLAWLFMLPKALRPDAESAGASDGRRRPKVWGRYFSEFTVSAVCGIFGGLLLYLILDNLDDIAAGFLWLVGNRSIVARAGSDPRFVACLGVPLVLLTFLLAATLFVGLAVRITDDEDREWMARLGAWILIVIFGWVLLSTAVIFGPDFFHWPLTAAILTSVGGVSGLVTLLLGFSSKSKGKDDKEAEDGKSLLMWFLPTVAAPVFVLFLAILISFLTDLLIDKAGIVENYRHVTWFVILVGVGSIMGYFININKFSIHSIYRERLIRAYLGASRTKERVKTANSFTGLDSQSDNIDMSRLRQKPLHVVNMTLNLVKTQNLRWQNRKAESFTATALYCGSSNMGDGSGNYRRSTEYGYNSQNNSAISLGTAAAISGAAASPNMGYFTMSAAVSFLMVLFNVRLGWWLGNPGRRGEHTYRLAAPTWSPWLFLEESVGGTDDSKKYVYLSDGGHFENLGLYEMVLRRCSLIVVIDAGCDLKFGFSDFGTAIHKIRVDMGIPIEFSAGQNPVMGRNCTIGKIRYDCVDPGAKDGTIIYIKPTLDGDEPIDLKNYARENPQFPHESTADQMYSESQFESYRRLGLHQISSICCNQDADCTCDGLTALVEKTKNYVSSSKPEKVSASFVSDRGIRAGRRR